MSQHNFEAETGKVLELLTHSIYSNKEIFLRELISNASDAIDKARLKSLTDTDYLGENSEFKIKIERDETKNILVIEDNGTGMTEDELHNHLGTIAKSGTKEFIEKLQQAKENSENNLIGQFGVGFYSAFMVADRVEVETKSHESDKSFIWMSDGKSAYEIKEGSRTTRGTKITIFIDEVNKELLQEWKVKELIKKYSNYVGVPIQMDVEEKDEEGKKTGTKIEQLNDMKSIWTKSKASVKKEEYDEFYKTLSMDFNESLAHIHNNVEGVVSYKSLLYIPREKNMFVNMADPQKEFGPKLYVKNVLILDHCKDLVPVWLRFVHGVVETSDIPLNVSRELLQSNTVLEKIKKGLVKKVISELQKNLKNNTENYDIFLNNYSEQLKEGVYYESELREDIVGLVKFETLEGKKITLDEYIENLKDKEKKELYFIAGKSKTEVLSSPYLEQFRESKVDVVLLSDPVDHFVVQVLKEYKEFTLKSVTSSDISLTEKSDEEVKKSEELKKDFGDFLELTKNTIGSEKIEKVELNEKLGSAMGALKTPENGVDPQMEKMMKAMGQAVPAQKRILELNPNNTLVQSMKSEFATDLKSEKLGEMMKYAYQQAILLEGGELDDMSEFITLVNKFAGKYM
ncbi:MAG: molecular chaperone HtpG [Candidatus Gracilibacteria bacterium]|nr:molecular chaperone HtpG [Candidatus Gracilibacteria bacterium]